MDYRIYYNRAEDAPQIWSVDEGNQGSEITVCGVEIRGCDVMTGCEIGAPAQSKQVPKVWIKVYRARLFIMRGRAYLVPVDSPLTNEERTLRTL